MSVSGMHMHRGRMVYSRGSCSAVVDGEYIHLHNAVSGAAQYTQVLTLVEPSVVDLIECLMLATRDYQLCERMSVLFAERAIALQDVG